ncbi:MAG: 4-hydroxy-3-methylbut-2-en-1-yl diphosphate synthase [Candidatus Wallbacteria bacterium HGW-Wallbacteria-1]|uniref:4-hydroxy-3-methylbut-2-en-1-yl diphosphate synthase (flavodoxin) n=1 Tax=Candidatus Wallbacteria bacterium HGW-Wallbacteria-1 TaxID=2013854 RepID=A0A2N1PRC0_9BACT|nr:MAG: 4-hydroxy-3-methylbut-2-en-1-yl diphosphate synthase [Candidatus Wallbacteria bacterium HGW-Wallbacteria-1]
MIPRRISRMVMVKDLQLGGGAPVRLQSMCNTDTRDSQTTLAQIQALAASGCELVRVAVKNHDTLPHLKKIIDASPLPVIADIHFDYTLALGSIEAGVAKLRINPGNIGSNRKLREVARAALDSGVPIRVGANSGSLEKELLSRYGPSARALAESALRNASLLENEGLNNLVLSMKGSDVRTTVEACRIVAASCDYPLHLGVTEAGPAEISAIRSSIALGALLLEGIGDTIRISVTGGVIEEMSIAKEILRCTGLRRDLGPTIISCPTCGRTEVDLLPLVRMVQRITSHITKPLKIAVMGCPVNGIGEARDADLGIAAAPSSSIVFALGKVLCRIPNENLEEEFGKIVRQFVSEE